MEEKELPKKKKKIEYIKISPIVSKSKPKKNTNSKIYERKESSRIFSQGDSTCIVTYPCGVTTEALVKSNPGSVLIEPVITNTAFFMVHKYDIKDMGFIDLTKVPFIRIYHSELNDKLLQESFP